MKVWLVVGGYNYESGYSMDLFSEKTDAEMFAEKLREDFEWVDIEQVEIK